MRVRGNNDGEGHFVAERTFLEPLTESAESKREQDIRGQSRSSRNDETDERSVT